MKKKIRPILKKLIQVGMVVSDLHASIEKYVLKYKIGPVFVLEYNSNTVENMMIYENKKNFSMNNGFLNIDDIQFEIIEPTSYSIYTDYLKKYGEGIIHHLKIEVSDYFEVLEYFKSLNVKIMLHGESLGDRGKNLWTYLDTRDILGFIIEIVKVDPHFIVPKPLYRFPKNRKMFKNPFFKKVSKVGLVVKDLETAIEKYDNLFGLSSWRLREFNNKNLSDINIYGKNKNYSVKVGYHKLGSLELVLTESLTESIFSDFLEKYGENTVCYLAMEVENYNDTLTLLNSKGIKVIQSGNYLNNLKYSYLSTNNDLNFIIEIAENNKSIDFVP